MASAPHALPVRSHERALIPAAPGRARVMLAGADRRFRAMAATLLSQHGYDVVAAPAGEDISIHAARAQVDVVVIDASASLTDAARQAAALDALRPRPGVVAVGGDRCAQLRALPVIPKWGAFDELQEAIEQALAGVSHVAG